MDLDKGPIGFHAHLAPAEKVDEAHGQRTGRLLGGTRRKFRIAPKPAVRPPPGRPPQDAGSAGRVFLQRGQTGLQGLQLLAGPCEHGLLNVEFFTGNQVHPGQRRLQHRLEIAAPDPRPWT